MENSTLGNHMVATRAACMKIFITKKHTKYMYLHGTSIMCMKTYVAGYQNFTYSNTWLDIRSKHGEAAKKKA